MLLLYAIATVAYSAWPHHSISTVSLRSPRCLTTLTVPFNDESSAAFAKLQVLSLPSGPSPELTPVDVVLTLCSGLKNNDVPNPNDGVRRVHEFTTFECRAALTSRKGARSGVERFVEHAALHALPGCSSYALAGEPTIIAGTQTRGAMASICVDVVEALSFRHKSGFERQKEDGSGDQYALVPAEEDLEEATRTERYLFQLAQERRPPLAGCWMVTSIMPARDHMLFNGDTGAVQG